MNNHTHIENPITITQKKTKTGVKFHIIIQHDTKHLHINTEYKGGNFIILNKKITDTDSIKNIKRYCDSSNII